MTLEINDEERDQLARALLILSQVLNDEIDAVRGMPATISVLKQKLEIVESLRQKLPM